MKTFELNIDNATLVQECRNGDRDAMSILYTRFAPRMLRVIYRYVSDKDSAQDILHDGFIAAFTRLDTLRDPERIDFWLATIMKNLSLKFLQAQSVTSLLDEIGEVADSDDILSERDLGLDFATIESLIRRLPKGYQKVFRLAVLEGKSHKEISEILGIAPNSSSSQLFHAKLRLRELIKDYQLRAGLISLLILIISTGIILLRRHSNNLNSHSSLSADATPKGQVSPLLPSDSIHNAGNRNGASTAATSKAAYVNVASITPIHIESTNSEETSSHSPAVAVGDYSVNPDSVAVSNPTEVPNSMPSTYPEENPDSFYDRLFAEANVKPSPDKGWSTGISVDPGLLSFNTFGDNGSFSSYPGDLNAPPSTDPDDEDTSHQSRIASRDSHTPESYLGSATRRHYLPISFALTTEKRFSSWLGIESGIGYSYLHTDFECYRDNRNEVSTCHWHYLEVPVKVNLYAYSNPRFKLYASLGGRVALPVYAYASIPTNPYCQSGRFSSKTVWSVGGSLGVAFSLSKRVDLFIEPSLRYHFPQQTALPNIWTDDEPFSVSIPFGLRLTW